MWINAHPEAAYWPLDLDKPISDHPLNAGKVLWWSGDPACAGGNFWFDLVQSIPIKFTSPPGAGFGWNPRLMGRNGQMWYHGNSTTSSPGSAATTITGWGAGVSGSVALWIRLTAIGSYNQIFIDNRVYLASGWAIFSDFNGNLKTISEKAGVENGASTFAATVGTTAINHVVISWNGTQMIVYVNGISASTTSPVFVAGTQPLTILNSCTAAITDLQYWNRALSAADALMVYQHSLMGNTQLLNKCRPMWRFPSSFGKTFSTSSAGTASVIKGVASGKNATATGSATTVRATAKSLAISAAGTASVKRAAATSKSATATGTGVVRKQPQHVLSASATGTGLVARAAMRIASAASSCSAILQTISHHVPRPLRVITAFVTLVSVAVSVFGDKLRAWVEIKDLPKGGGEG